jgi:hypothetical protein
LTNNANTIEIQVSYRKVKGGGWEKKDRLLDRRSSSRCYVCTKRLDQNNCAANSKLASLESMLRILNGCDNGSKVVSRI